MPACLMLAHRRINSSEAGSFLRLIDFRVEGLGFRVWGFGFRA